MVDRWELVPDDETVGVRPLACTATDLPDRMHRRSDEAPQSLLGPPERTRLQTLRTHRRRIGRIELLPGVHDAVGGERSGERREPSGEDLVGAGLCERTSVVTSAERRDRVDDLAGGRGTDAEESGDVTEVDPDPLGRLERDERHPADRDLESGRVTGVDHRRR